MISKVFGGYKILFIIIFSSPQTQGQYLFLALTASIVEPSAGPGVDIP